MVASRSSPQDEQGCNEGREPIENAGKMMWTLIVNPNWIRESSRA
jgi:hypothetical protein